MRTRFSLNVTINLTIHTAHGFLCLAILMLACGTHESAQKSGKPLVTVRGGGPGRGQPCEAQSAHGYVGVERETVLAMRAWIKTGIVPDDVKP